MTRGVRGELRTPVKLILLACLLSLPKWVLSAPYCYVTSTEGGASSEIAFSVGYHFVFRDQYI